MKQTISTASCILLLGLSLLSCKKNTSTDLIVFDLNGNFPVKTLDIEDVAEIEYLTLELHDDYLFTELAQMTDSFMICYGEEESFIFFDRTTGQPVSKVSRYGNGPEEYTSIFIPVYSETKDELFILDYPSIKVYGRDGTFKRKLPFGRDLGVNWGIPPIFDYDEEHLLLSVFSYEEEAMKDTSFILLSKQDGLVEGIRIPYKERVNLFFIRENNEGVAIPATPPNVCWAVRNGKDFLLTEYASDTVFRFTPERELIPVLIRTPSIQQMETKTFLHSWVETSRYLFFCTEKLEFDWNDLEDGFPTKGYLMEKHSGEFFQTHIQMRDFKGKELILGSSVIGGVPNGHTGIITLKASELQAANKENKLSGKLKEVTDCLTEIDEYIFMILKFK